MKLQGHQSITLLSVVASCTVALLACLAGGCDKREGTGSSPDTVATRAQGTIAAHSHENPDETCFICDPSKREAGRLWCREHDRYEDRCWLCHPELEDKDRPFCTEHSLYEDECHLCHPELKSPVPDGAASAETPETLFCTEHGVPEDECGICHPERAETLEPGQGMKVRFVSKEAAQKAGIRVGRPQHRPSMSTVEALCQIRYNENALAHVTPLASGVIQDVLVDLGSRVDAGDVLFEIRSPEVAEAKGTFLSAVVDHQIKQIAHEREKKLMQQKVSATRDYQEAQAAWNVARLTENTARQGLLNLGFGPADIAAIEKDQDSSSVLSVRAPFAGTLVTRSAVIGERVTPGDSLFLLADLTNIWLDLSVPEDKAALLHPGQAVEATLDSLGTVPAEGKLVWIDTSVDERSRMLKARAVVPNSGSLKNGMFGHARIITGQRADALYVPRDAVQHLSAKPYLFVREADDLYALRRISLGSRTPSAIEVTAGIGPREDVVVAGSFIALSEFLKSRLGAGCVDD